MTEKKLLRGKIADILNEYSVAINIGKNEGVKVGMIFAILGEKSIMDPDSGKMLGQYEFEKVRVTINQVDDQYSVAATVAQIALPFGWAIEQRPTVVSKKTELGVSRTASIGDIVEERRRPYEFESD